MDKPLNMQDLLKLEQNLRSSVEQDRRYWRVNDVKCDAIHTAKTYEEFSDRVAAAHLKALEKGDHVKAGSCQVVWNSVAQTGSRVGENHRGGN